MQPPEIFGYSTRDQEIRLEQVDLLPVLVALSSALGYAVCAVQCRALKDVNLFVMTAWLGVLGAVPTVIAGFAVNAFCVPNLEDSMLLLALGCSGWLAINTFLLAFMARGLKSLEN